MKQISNSRDNDYEQNVSFLSFCDSRQDLDTGKKVRLYLKRRGMLGLFILSHLLVLLQ